MPNRGNLNWSGSNTTYSIPSGYYSGGTLDSRTSYMNGYNKGKEEGSSNVEIGGSNYTSSMINLPSGEGISASLSYTTSQEGVEIRYSKILQIPLPKSNPSKVIINCFSPTALLEVHRHKYVNSSSGTNTDSTSINAKSFTFIDYYSESVAVNGYTSTIEGDGTGYVGASFDTSTNWNEFCKIKGYSISCYVTLQYRTNGKFLEFRLETSVGLVSPITVAYYSYSGSISVNTSTKKQTSTGSGPYGSPTYEYCPMVAVISCL